MNDRSTTRVMFLGLIAVAVCYGLIWLTGCSASKAWHPATKKEMRMLIGHTTLEAIHQYRNMTLNPKPHEVPPLEKSLEEERHKV